MIKGFVRWLLVILVVIYAGWIAWPVFKTWLWPDFGPQTPSFRADDLDYTGRAGLPTDTYDPYAPPMESIQGENAVEAVFTGNTPVFVLWGAVIGFYLIAAFLHANGNLRATAAYALGFIADLSLTFLGGNNGGGGPLSRLIEMLSGWDPRYVITLAALVLGFLIYMSRQSPKNRITGIREAKKFFS